MGWLAQYFLNPGLVLPGAALALVPIIIHILSRLRHKRIRFAAMEFLLQSDQLNRRRLILEQLLLLFLRVMAVLLAALLLARLLLDPSHLLMLAGSTVHHIVILDDSLSMRERVDDGTVFGRAVNTLEQMLSQGENRMRAARISVLLMSEPERPVIADRRLDGALLQETASRLRNLQCSYRAVSPVNALATARDLLAADAGTAPRVHLVTDLRASDWLGRPEVLRALGDLDAIDASVTLIRVTTASPENVAIQQIDSDTLEVARGIPWRMNLRLWNAGTRRVSGLRATVLVDGMPLPTGILLPDLEADSSVTVSHDITFDTDGRHQVEVRVDDDVLPEDNHRYAAVEVTDKRPILIIDDDGQQEDAGFVAAALSADSNLTGLAVDVRPSQALNSGDLAHYDCIYLLNVRDLPADTTRLLGDYVRSGGGIVWFPGDQANTLWYGQTLRDPAVNLFPVPLGTVHDGERPAAIGGGENPAVSPVFSEHPIFTVYNLPDNPFSETLRLQRWFQVSSDWVADDGQRDDGVKTLARLRSGDPVVFEHSLGAGRILTFLTGAGRRWSNWPIAPAAPGYVVMHLLIHPYLQRPAEGVREQELTEPLQLRWPVSAYTENVEVFLPEPESGQNALADTFVRLQATLLPQEGAADAEPELGVTISQADRPGVYRIRRLTSEGNSSETWYALNVPTAESALELAEPQQVIDQPGLDHVQVLDSSSATSLGGREAGRELRWLLVGLLIAVLVAEQLLSLRMSFHPEGT